MKSKNDLNSFTNNKNHPHDSWFKILFPRLHASTRVISTGEPNSSPPSEGVILSKLSSETKNNSLNNNHNNQFKTYIQGTPIQNNTTQSPSTTTTTTPTLSNSSSPTTNQRLFKSEPKDEKNIQNQSHKNSNLESSPPKTGILEPYAMGGGQTRRATSSVARATNPLQVYAPNIETPKTMSQLYDQTLPHVRAQLRRSGLRQIGSLRPGMHGVDAETFHRRKYNQMTETRFSKNRAPESFDPRHPQIYRRDPSIDAFAPRQWRAGMPPDAEDSRLVHLLDHLRFSVDFDRSVYRRGEMLFFQVHLYSDFSTNTNNNNNNFENNKTNNNNNHNNLTNININNNFENNKTNNNNNHRLSSEEFPETQVIVNLLLSRPSESKAISKTQRRIMIGGRFGLDRLERHYLSVETSSFPSGTYYIHGESYISIADGNILFRSFGPIEIHLY